MAEAVYSSEAGVVTSITLEGSLPARIAVENFSDLRAAIIDDIQVDQATNHQFNTSLADAVYLYIFGDQMGSIVLSGKLFSANCSGGSRSGIEEILDYYKTNRVSRRDTPVQVFIGGEVISGYLTRLKIQATGDGETNRINSFSMSISALPDDTTG